MSNKQGRAFIEREESLLKERESEEERKATAARTKGKSFLFRDLKGANIIIYEF